jgi:hypothetical protein
MRNSELMLILVALVLFIPVSTYSADKPSGLPFQAIQQKTDQIEIELQKVQDDVEDIEVLIQQAIEQHHKELIFTIPPGQSHSFTLPKVQAPVRVEVSVSWLDPNSGFSAPSQIMYAVISQDPNKFGNLTWVGTSADGTVEAGYTSDPPEYEWIARIGPQFPRQHATLEVDDWSTVPATLKIQSYDILTGQFIVHLWY